MIPTDWIPAFAGMTTKKTSRPLSRLNDQKSFATVIAIDGPAGAGKSTVARLVAKRLGYLFVNTGDMYRALTWKALQDKVKINSRDQIVKFLKNNMKWQFHVHDKSLKISLNGRDLGRELRSEKVSRLTPAAAQYPEVRRLLRSLQRQAAAGGRAVLEGRDTTTHVVPAAGLKVYLDAAVEERAKRRYYQLLSENKRVKLSSIREAIRIRDLQERKRKIMPSYLAPGAIRVDTTNLTLHETADKIIRLYEAGRRRKKTV
ncbi:MAG: (d)CMP kinase [Elusimicrobia bacterium]|nr:(d)CMP kinase [Elusimicrobiota bacterium]